MFQCGKPDARLEFAVVAGPSAVGPAAADVGLVRLPNFRGLVLGCMDSYDSEQRRILQHFSISTRFAFFCTAPISNFADCGNFFL